ncbi:hypothetical protein K439DRAFT_1367001, partial [Ramaria rubella]
SNHNVELVMNGEATKNLTFYICCYNTKKQARSYNTSALLAEGLAYHNTDDKYMEDHRERNRFLLFQCLHTLNWEQELSGPIVISLLMGWGDTYMSYRYVPIYWSTFVGYLLKIFPYLKRANQ